MLERLKVAGAETRIWPTQFGFKSKSGTSDALFVVRRLLDQVWETSDGTVIMLTLDWAKAFDSISPIALLNTLQRFGVPRAFRNIVGSIYLNCRFFVSELNTQSQDHLQYFGISQGYPLSSFLFIILMTVLMTDAKE